MRIKLIVSDPQGRRDPSARAARLDPGQLRPGTRLEVSPTRNGPRSSGSGYDHSLAELATLDAGMGAQGAGFDAVCIDDPSDPALDALRSRLDIPVTGAGSGALWLGRLVGLPVAYVAPLEEVAGIEGVLRGVDRRAAFAIPFSIGSGAPHAESDEAVVDAAAEAARRGAACIALVADAEAHRDRVAAATGLPVFGATMAAVKLAEVMFGLGLASSRMAYVAARRDQDELVSERLRPEADSQAAVTVTSPLEAARARRIRVIVPHSDMDAAAVGRRADVIVPGLLQPETLVEYAGIRSSPNRADSPYATLLMDLFSFEAGLRAAEDGFDALTVDSTTDSGISGLRSRLPILVLGTGQATWALAAALSGRFSILAMEPEWAYFYRRNLKAARLPQALASVKVVGRPTDPYKLFEGKEDDMYRLLTELGRSAIEDDGAEAIVVGSTTMHQAGDHLAAALPAPVLNPGRVALRSIEAVLEMGLLQSRVAAPAPDRLNDEIFE